MTSFLLSVAFFLFQLNDTPILAGDSRFFWLMYGCLSFAFWNYLPYLVEEKSAGKRPSKNLLLLVPVLITVASVTVSNDYKKIIAILVSTCLFFWLTCMAFFGRSSFSPTIYRLAKDPFSIIFNATRKPDFRKNHYKKDRKR